MNIIRNTYKRLLILSFMLICLSTVQAQRKFNPEKFKEELRQFIVKEANLNQQEAKTFLPLFDEMMSKQRPYFDKLRRLHHSKPNSEREARALITTSDQCEIELKRIEARYHERMLKTLSAVKLSQALNAERRFHRQTFRKMAGK